MARTKKNTGLPPAGDYRHKEQTPARPDVGTQPQFRKRAAPRTYRYDSSLSPALDWDGSNSARQQGEMLIREVLEAETLEAAKSAATKLKALSRPFLDWAGKAERLSFDVPTLPLFVHERLSTRAILETLKGHRSDKQLGLFDLFADPQRSIHDQVLRAYEYKDDWVNRMILGDSLVVMNSLLHYESLGGQVQMIYMDPPYGVKFGSNFQPFVRKRDVAHNDDEDMTREPEMVQAYRDTWELNEHSYLSYLRDRLLLCRDLLAPSGSIFLQISDENLHHVREVMDDVFGVEQFAGLIAFYKTSSQSTAGISSVVDYLVCYARDLSRQKLRPLLRPKRAGERGAKQYTSIVSPDFTQIRRMSAPELSGIEDVPAGWKVCRLGPITSQGFQEARSQPYMFEGRAFACPANRHWSYDPSPGAEMDRLAKLGRLRKSGSSLATVLLAEDNPTTEIDNVWLDTGTGSFTEEQVYVVQTAEKALQRCLHMTTDPGDLVLDPTCGSGTTAYVAEQWGRRWLMIDTSRVPLALARQRLLTATFPWYELKDEARGPAGGFIYKRKQNTKGEEVGGIVPHITLKSIANDEPPQEEVLVDRPEEVKSITRVSGPFVVEATIPGVTESQSTEAEGYSAAETAGEDEAMQFADRMLEVLRKSPVLRLEGNRSVTLKSVRRPAKTLSLSAEAMVENGESKPVAFVFSPENGAVVERLVFEAAKEAVAKSYTHLYVVGFAIQPTARQLVEACEQVMGIAATYVQATPDLMMGDLLKNMRSSQIFSVCGLPEIALRPSNAPDHITSDEQKRAPWFEVELLGLDVFDPVTMVVDHRRGNDVPAWFLDTDYNGLSFHVTQAFFPRTAAWDNLKRALKGEYEDAVWEHLAGTISVPFEAGQHRQVAVKVIDDRGNELMVVKSLKEST